MKKNRIIMVLSVIALASCTKDAEMNMAENKTFEPEKNTFRAVQIEGNNAHWGDYVLKLKYKNEKLESCIREDCEGDTLGNIDITRSTDLKYVFYVNDYVVSIDADSIQRLDARLKATYGAGNYSLKDSLSRRTQTLLHMTVDLYKDGRIVRQTATYYVPRENVGIGEDFDYTYLKDRRVTDLYEYDQEGRICACREFYDVFDREDAEIYIRSLYKEEYVYNGKNLTDIIMQEAKDGENFTEYERYTFQRNGERIENIIGKNGAKRHFVWTSGVLSSIQNEDGSTYSYTWDGNGFVTGLDTGDNKVTHVAYEAGNGNISWVSPLRNCLHGTPYIK